MRLLVSIIFAGLFGLISCQKEHSCEKCLGKNIPPIAYAGQNQIITLPTDSVLLDGSLSKDPDGTIVSFLWTKISGPPSSSIDGIAKPVVKNLSAGNYLFELKVTDDGGLSGKDTVMVTVDVVPTLQHAPVADAGPDQSISLPVSTLILDGSNSTDPDNNINGYFWREISGPAACKITNAADTQARISELVEGTYEFELKVTDSTGLLDIDTTIVIVTIDNSASPDCVIPSATHLASFSSGRVGLASAVCNDRFYYSDGWKMDVFDPVTNSIITSTNLSMARAHVSAVTAANMVFFAGGYIYPPTTMSQGTYISRVDIYNTTSGTWTTSELSTPRIISAGTCAIGNKVFFAGGLTQSSQPSSRIDIYDLPTNSWTQRELLHPGTCLIAKVQNKAWFITHGSSQIDVYDPATDGWSILNLPSPIYSSLPAVIYQNASLQIGNKIYFTGCQQVKVYDVITGSWSEISLPESLFHIPAIAANGKIAFMGGMTSYFKYSSKIEIYDPATSSWSSSNMGADLYYEALIGYNNFIYTAGGLINQENTELAGICRFGL